MLHLTNCQKTGSTASSEMWEGNGINTWIAYAVCKYSIRLVCKLSTTYIPHTEIPPTFSNLCLHRYEKFLMYIMLVM